MHSLLIIGKYFYHFKYTAVPVIIGVTDDNDNAPAFENPSYNAMVTENKKVGSSVIQVRAKDPDFGPNGKVSYSLERANGFFAINAETGITWTYSCFVALNKWFDCLRYDCVCLHELKKCYTDTLNCAYVAVGS